MTLQRQVDLQNGQLNGLTLLYQGLQGCRKALKMTGSILALLKIDRFNSYNLGNFTGSNVPV